VRHAGRLRKTTPLGVVAAFEPKGDNATKPTKALDLSASGRRFSLSPGERAGVRASV
jgi:hypothetical protein